VFDLYVGGCQRSRNTWGCCVYVFARKEGCGVY